MNYKALTVITFIQLPLLTFGQTLVTGRVIDLDTKKPVKEATIEIAGTSIKTVTNVLGYFQLTTDSTSRLVIKRDGYETSLIKVPNATRFQIQLSKDLTPDFKNGINEFYRFLAESLRYPEQARKKDTQGRVYVSFELDSLQGIRNIKIIKDIGSNCGGEVRKVLMEVPNKWIPKSKSVTLILPVTFRMETIKLGFIGTDVELPKGKLLNEVVVTAPRPR